MLHIPLLIGCYYNGIHSNDWLLFDSYKQKDLNAYAYHFHGVFILKWSKMNGQRFHQQKRIETKTEQCERSLRV